MKKIIALLLCCFLCLSLFAGCNQDADQPTDHTHDENGNHVEEPSSSEAPTQEDHSDHNHVNYKGLSSAAATLEDVAAAEGREADFSFEAGGTTYYAYNNVSLDALTFTQVQYSFNEGYVRISCTYSADGVLEEIYSLWEQEMTGLYGESSALNADGSVIKWADHTGNYVTLTYLNDTTVQLCFYLTA